MPTFFYLYPPDCSMFTNFTESFSLNSSKTTEHTVIKLCMRHNNFLLWGRQRLSVRHLQTWEAKNTWVSHEMHEIWQVWNCIIRKQKKNGRKKFILATQKTWSGLSPTRNPVHLRLWGLSFSVLKDMPNWDSKVQKSEFYRILVRPKVRVPWDRMSWSRPTGVSNKPSGIAHYKHVDDEVI